MDTGVRFTRNATLAVCLAALPLLSACISGGGGGGGGNSYKNHDFGDNDRNKVVAIGDSITKGGQCDDETVFYPTRVAQMTGLSVVNSGISGEKSSGAASRTGRVLDNNKPGFLLILTGHNDAIFDRDTEEVVGNIRAMIQACRNRKTVPIVGTLVPIHSPRSFATRPARRYNEAIRIMVKEEGVALVDLEKEFGDDQSLQCDGLHPNDTGSAIIAAAFSDKLP